MNFITFYVTNQVASFFLATSLWSRRSWRQRFLFRSRSRFFWTFFQIYCQLLNKFSEEEWIGVLAELIEDKPVSQLTFRQDVLETLANIFIIFMTNLEK